MPGWPDWLRMLAAFVIACLMMAAIIEGRKHG